MANIKQQKKRVETASRQRLENLRYRSTIKTLAKRLERAVDCPHELAVLRRDEIRVAVLDGAFEALRERLDRRAVAQVLEPLA